MKIGIVGMGVVGSAYARYFEQRGFSVIKYSLEPEFLENKDLIRTCDITFIAVPTPTTPVQIDLTAVLDAVSLVGPNQIAILKSTVLPGTAQYLQDNFPLVAVVSSPEFLSMDSADTDVARPILTLLGFPKNGPREASDVAKELMTVLPHIPGQTFGMSSTEAELVKYAHNVSAVINILLYNVLYDVAQRFGSDWTAVQHAIQHDPYLASQYSTPEHKDGRGAGGPCFIKDFEAFRRLVAVHPAAAFLEEAVRYNLHLLESTGKNLPEIETVYEKESIQ